MEEQMQEGQGSVHPAVNGSLSALRAAPLSGVQESQGSATPAMPTYPALFTVHWATGPTPCCVKHAQGLIRLGAMLGVHVPATKAEEGAQCANCINEARATGASND